MGLRIFVSVDMEGATGIVHGDQLLPGKSDYARGREFLTRDVVAAVGAALSNDEVSYVRVCDGHGTMRNLLLEKFPAGCDVILGPASSKTLCQSEGLDDSFHAAMYVGYHARAGTQGAVLPHTWVGSVIHEVRVNGKVFGEAAINAALAGHFGVPAIFLSGDEAACREAKADIGAHLVTVPVKRAVGPRAAILKPPAVTEGEIRLGVLQALQDRAGAAPLRVPGPVDFAIVFHTVAQAERAARRGTSERTGDREITLRRPDYLAAVREAWQVVEWTASENPEWLQ
ncbi:MAG: D-aminopeptidase [Planctomycetes bacterium]|nr:D-aminopeptidase [Planctomycetota bacterium]